MTKYGINLHSITTTLNVRTEVVFIDNICTGTSSTQTTSIGMLSEMDCPAVSLLVRKGLHTIATLNHVQPTQQPG